MIQIKVMFEIGKPDIVLKTIKVIDIKRTSFTILIPENSFKLGIVLVMLDKMLVIVLIIDLYSGYGSGS